ncbi:MAG: TlpA family protein disulfide reductase [Phycisphaeraceae bacterium]|nr:TlpA family protein disulfide reductase [Phycisphaeraceae bacterium]
MSMIGTAFLVGHVLFGAGTGTPPAPFGVYDAWIESPGGRIPFILEVRPRLEFDAADPTGAVPTDAELGAFVVAIQNGDERVTVTSAAMLGETLVLRFDPYEAELHASPGTESGTLEGRWIRRRGKQQFVAMPFGGGPVAPEPLHRPDPVSIEHRWRMEFAPVEPAPALKPESSGPAPIESPDVGLVRVRADGRATGTILSTTGDARYLHGTFDGTTLELASFSGSGASLYRAVYTPASDGSPATLTGERWSGSTSHRRFKGVADSGVALPDDMAITRAIARPDLDALRFIDERGNTVALSALIDGPAILQIFGTWCPNSNDAAALMDELHAICEAQGVDLVALAFESDGEFATDSVRIAQFRARHGVRYPILFAGESDKAKARARLPFLDRVHSYPSILFLNAAGDVSAIHTGYCGPATGAEHARMVDRILGAVLDIVPE